MLSGYFKDSTPNVRPWCEIVKARKITSEKNGFNVKSLFLHIRSNLGMLFSVEEQLNVLLHPINDSENHTSDFCLGEYLNL